MKTVPAVVVGDRYVLGARLRDVAALVGKPYQERRRLSPGELVARLDTVVLPAAQRYLRQVPDDKLGLKSPDRDRPLRVLGYHVFRLVQGFLEADAGTPLTYGMLGGAPPDSVTSAAALAAYGDEVRQQLREWWSRQGGRSFDNVLETYYGPQTAHELLERSAWHSAQHARQLMMFLGWLGIEPDGPLSPADLEGLPLPEGVWI